MQATDKSLLDFEASDSEDDEGTSYDEEGGEKDDKGGDPQSRALSDYCPCLRVVLALVVSTGTQPTPEPWAESCSEMERKRVCLPLITALVPIPRPCCPRAGWPSREKTFQEDLMHLRPSFLDGTPPNRRADLCEASCNCSPLEIAEEEEEEAEEPSAGKSDRIVTSSVVESWCKCVGTLP